MTTDSKKTCDACHQPINSGYLCDSCTELALAEIMGPPVQVEAGGVRGVGVGEPPADVSPLDMPAPGPGIEEVPGNPPAANLPREPLPAGAPGQEDAALQHHSGPIPPPEPLQWPPSRQQQQSGSLVVGQPYQPPSPAGSAPTPPAMVRPASVPPAPAPPAPPMGHRGPAAAFPPVTLEQVKAAAREGRPDPYVGRTMQGYHILKRLGMGGMAAVYLAEQLDLQRKIALKIMFPSPGGNRPDKQARFFREAKAASQLQKDSIATIYNYGALPDGSLFIAMELVDGPSLGAILKSEGSLPIERSLDLGIQIAEGLGIAHAKNIVHRDLKPDNVLIASGLQGHEVPKIVDFGIAVVVEETPEESDEELDSAGRGKRGRRKGKGKGQEMVRGTPIYMSPEQARGDTVDARSDIYSFGVILYYMLTGQYPIKADSPLAYLKAHQVQIPQPPGLMVPYDMPPELDALIMTCLEKDPDHRPPDMVTVIGILKTVQARLLGLAGGGDSARSRDDDYDPYGLDAQYYDDDHYERSGRGGRPGWIWAIIGVAALMAAGLAAYAYYYILPPPVGQSVVFDAHTLSGSLVLSTSTDSLPKWMGEVKNGVPPAYSGSGAAFPQIGRSGPVLGSEEGRGMVVNDVLERVALRVMDEAGEQGLAMLMRGLIGGGRTELDGQFRAAVQKSVLVGPDSETEEVCTRFISGQKQVADRVTELLWKGKQSLRAGNVYWEKYQPPGAASLVKKDFYLVWGQVSLSDENVETLREVLTKSQSVEGMTLIDFYPSLAWRFPSQKGVFVTRVESSSPAASGGVVIGDLIMKVGRTQVTSASQVAELFKGSGVRPGTKVELEVARPSTTDSSIENKVLTITIQEAAPKGSTTRSGRRQSAPGAPAARPSSRPARKPAAPSGGGSIFE